MPRLTGALERARRGGLVVDAVEPSKADEGQAASLQIRLPARIQPSDVPQLLVGLRRVALSVVQVGDVAKRLFRRPFRRSSRTAGGARTSYTARSYLRPASGFAAVGHLTSGGVGDPGSIMSIAFQVVPADRADD